MLKVGLLGVGHLGKIHLKLLQEIEGVEVVGFYDPDDEKAAKIADQFNVWRYAEIDKLIDDSDAVDIVTPTLSHFECAELAIKKSKHIFIEKPLSNTLEEARRLVDLVHEAGIKAQVGHVERFNPAFLALKGRKVNPMFIETHRLAQFNPRGTDVAVILDLMIHDIDIILKLTGANVRKISASGVPIISRSPDIANARIEFDNGCVANVTASRISLKNMRKMRIFQPDAYISVDFLDKKTDIVRLASGPEENGLPSVEIETGDPDNKKYISFESPEIPTVNAIKMELEEFRDAIKNDTEPPVTVSDGYRAMEVAYMVLEKIQRIAVE